MSGGSYNYAFHQVNEAAYAVRARADGPNRSLRLAFADHLEKVAKAMHDIEWVDSGDYGDGDEVKAIEACLGPGAALEAVKNEAKEVLERLKAALEAK